MLKSVIFDFDGVICESVEAKTEAFRRLFQAYPDYLDAIVKVHMDHGGISRFKKFEMIYRDILKKDLGEEESRILGQTFTAYCYDAVVKAPFVRGAYEFLRDYHQALDLFVVSGTPEEEMISIVKEKQLSHFFKGVYGSPRSKAELISLILREHDLMAEEIVFVGDAASDQEGAEQAGVRFIGRIHENYANPFLAIPEGRLIRDIIDLKKLISSEKSMKRNQKEVPHVS